MTEPGRDPRTYGDSDDGNTYMIDRTLPDVYIDGHKIEDALHMNNVSSNLAVDVDKHDLDKYRKKRGRSHKL